MWDFMGSALWWKSQVVVRSEDSVKYPVNVIYEEEPTTNHCWKEPDLKSHQLVVYTSSNRESGATIPSISETDFPFFWEEKVLRKERENHFGFKDLLQGTFGKGLNYFSRQILNSFLIWSFWEVLVFKIFEKFKERIEIRRPHVSLSS